MRILAITNLYPRSGHGTLAPFNRQQFASLAENHNLAVVAPVPWTEELRDRKAGHPIQRRYRSTEGIEVRHPRFYFPPRICRASYGHFFLMSIQPEVRRIAREFRPEVVLGCWAHPDGWAAVRLAREVGVPVVVKVIGSDVLVIGGRARRAQMAEGLRQSDAVVAVSRDLADHVISIGVDPDRVHVVSEGLNLELFRPGDRDEARRRLGLECDRQLILFVGNLLMSKGAGILIESMAQLKSRGVSATCVLVGRGRDESALRSLIKKNALGDSVTLVGPKPHADLVDWYRACDAVALPSFSEGIPNVLREAAACGRPYVATRVGGIPELAVNHVSRLVPPGNSSALTEALVEVLALGPQPASPGISWGESADQLTEILRSVTQNSIEASRTSC